MDSFNFEKFFEPYKHLNIETNKSRYNFYKSIVCQLVQKNRPIYIVETGTMYEDPSTNMASFTLIFGDLIKNITGGKIYTVDISQEHSDISREITKEFSDVIEYAVSDSIEYLKNLTHEEVKNVDLFIFDSYDLFLPDPLPSAIHHLEELLCIYYRLSNDVIIAVDDNYISGSYVMWNWLNTNGEIVKEERVEVGKDGIGKGMLIDIFLRARNWKRMDNLIHVGSNNIFCYGRHNE